VLAKYCVSCHSAEKSKGDLRLDTFEMITKGGEAGAALVAGDAKKSPLVARLLLPADHDDHMPPDGKPQPTAGRGRADQVVGRFRRIEGQDHPAARPAPRR
jgi:hypothetical protein